METGKSTPGQKVYLAQALYKNKKKNKARVLLESVINTSPRSGNIVEDWEQINKAKVLIKDYK